MFNKKKYNKKYCKLYRQKNKKKHLAYNRLWRKQNPDKNWAMRSLSDHKTRKYTVKISRIYLENLRVRTKKCCYCNCKLRYGKGKPHAKSPTLDVIDGSKNIVKNNIQVICFECNKIKGRKTHNQFVGYCGKIYQKFQRG